MSQNRLDDLAILSIENERVFNLNVQKRIKTFVSSNETDKFNKHSIFFNLYFHIM